MSHLAHDEALSVPENPDTPPTFAVDGVDEPDESGSSLPRADGGKDAWLFLAGSFVMEALVWGFALSFGVLQEYYSSHEPFASEGNIATIGTTASGLMYMGLPIWFIALLAFPSIRRPAQAVGLVILCAAIVGSSFANSTNELIVSQGVFYAIGGTTAYAPTVLFLDEWFVQRKGLAFGVVWAGTAVAGVVVPLAMNATLKAYDFRVALRGWAVIVFVLSVPALYAIKPRLPPHKTRRFDFSFLLRPSFILFQLVNTVQAAGFFIPSIYLPTYARSLGASAITASSTLVALNLAAVIGYLWMGRAVDKFHVTIPMLICAVGSTLSVLCLWGLATNLARIFAFAVLYGLFAGGYPSLWAGMMRIVTGKTARAEPTLAFGFLAAGRGVGNVVSGPVSEALLRRNVWHGGAGYGSGYGPVVVFTGVTACVSGFVYLARAAKGFL